MALFRKLEGTNQPIGDDAFIERLERALDRMLKPKKLGPEVIDSAHTRILFSSPP